MSLFWKSTSLLFVMSLALALPSCVPFPRYKTLRPEAAITVMDEHDLPVSGAKVTLISSAYPYGLTRERLRAEQSTGADGRASFEAYHEWHMESPLMLHGALSYFWNWCVEKPGYETYMTDDDNADDFDRQSVIHLQPGTSRSCEPR